MDPKPQKRVTMRMLAEKLGVTKTTVSLALRGHKTISKATRDRVVKLAEEMNYRPDPAIAAIASQRWSTGTSERHRVIAFLCHHQPAWKGIQFEYFATARQRAEELGFKLEPFFVDDYPSASSIQRVLYTRGIRGILVPPIFNPDSKRVMNMDWSKFTAVCCGIGRVCPPLHTVTSDYFVTTRFVWEVVFAAGFKKVGGAICCHNPVADDDWHRIGASCAALEIRNVKEASEIPILKSDVRDEEALVSWYKTYRPEVIIAFNQHAGEVLEKHGVRIPEDVQLVCLGSVPGGKWSGVTHNRDLIGRYSMEVLSNEMRDNRWGLPDLPNLILVHPEWNKGTTFLHGDFPKTFTYHSQLRHVPLQPVTMPTH